MKKTNSAKALRRFSLAILTVLFLFPVSYLYNTKAQNDQNITPVFQTGHSSEVYAAAISADNRLVVTGGGDGTIRYWDRFQGRLSMTVRAHHGSISALVFSPDGKQLFSGGEDAVLRRWNTRTGQLEQSYIGHSQGIGCIAVSEDGNYVVTGAGGFGDVEGSTDNTLRLWDVPSGKPLNVFKGHKEQIASVAFSARADRIVSGGYDNAVKIWDVTAATPLLSITTESVESVAFNPDGTTVASAEPEKVAFWNARTGVSEGLIKHDKGTNQVIFSADWRTMFVGRRETQLWDVGSRRMVRSLDNDDSGQTAISDDNRFLVSAGYNSLSIWDVNRNSEIENFGSNAAKPHFTRGLAISASGKKAAWSGAPINTDDMAGDSVYFFDLERLKIHQVLPTDKRDVINEVAFSPDEKMLVGCGDEGVVIWSVGSGKLLKKISDDRPDTIVCESAAFSNDGDFLAVAGSIINKKPGTTQLDYKTSYLGIQIFEAGSWRLSRTLRLPVPVTSDSKSLINSVAFSPNGKLLVSGDTFGQVTLWNLQNGTPKNIKGHQYSVESVAFSPSGAAIASASFDETIKIWDVISNSFKLRKQLKGHGAAVSGVQYGANGQTLISGSWDQSVRIWDINAETAAILEGHTGAINSIAISPDGRTIFSAADDGLVNIWSVPNKTLISSILISGPRGGVNVTPDGYYSELSRGGSDLIGWRRNEEVVFDGSLQSRLSKPEILLARFRGNPPVIQSSSVPQGVTRPENAQLDEAEKTLRRQWQGHKFFALVIGNQNYDSLRNLKTSINDATEVADILEKRYNFRVTLVLDGTRAEILSAFQKHERITDEDSSFLVYYAGHGNAYENIETSFWQPKDADTVSRTNWIGSDQIRDSLNQIKSRHVLIVSDSCFAGALFRGPSSTSKESPTTLLELMNRQSRSLLTSGSFEPVSDSGKGGHSVFANAFISGLRRMPYNIFTADYLYFDFIEADKDRDAVGQTPNLRDVLSSKPGDTANIPRGKFIFVRNP